MEVRTEEQREAWQEGRDETAELFPIIDDEGYKRGRQSMKNDIALRFRRRAAEDPSFRTFLVELLNDV